MAHFLDANIFLRFLTGDDRFKAAACRDLIRKTVDGEVELETHPLILAEVVWVLESYYKLPRMQIAEKLDLILNTPNLTIADGNAFSEAVELYSQSALDLADCFVVALATRAGSALISYDAGFDRLHGVVRKEPEDIR